MASRSDHHIAFKTLLKRIREDNFGHPTVRELADEFGLSKDAVQRLLDRLEYQGLITKAPSKGITTTGQLAYQGHISLSLGPVSVQIVASLRTEQPYWPHKVQLIERLLKHQGTPICFERQFFAPQIHITNADLGNLQQPQLEGFISRYSHELLDTHTQLGAHPIPSSMAHILKLNPQTVLTQHTWRHSGGKDGELLWVTERFFVPGYHFHTHHLS